MVHSKYDCTFVYNDQNKYDKLINLVDNLFLDILPDLNKVYIFTERVRKGLYITVCVYNNNLYIGSTYTRDIILNMIVMTDNTYDPYQYAFKAIRRRIDFELAGNKIFEGKSAICNSWKLYLYDKYKYSVSVSKFLIKVSFKLLNDNDIQLLPPELLKSGDCYHIIVILKQMHETKLKGLPN